MKKPFIEIDAEHFTLSTFEPRVIDGYELPTNKETGEQFPNCCSYHKSTFKSTQDWFEVFPNCCDGHRAMVSQEWFNKNNYNGIAMKVVRNLSITEYHISKQIENEDWYKDITDYIDYIIFSFGQPAIGLHLYLANLKHYILESRIEIQNEKITRIVEFIDMYYVPAKTEGADLHILYSTYQKWLKIFPFDISYFVNLKPYYEKQIPILNGKPEINKYTGFAKGKLHTKGSLIDVLLSLTKNLLDKINIPELRKQGALTDIEANQLEFADAELNTKTAEITKQYSKGELKYVKALKKWLSIHKEYFQEVKPLLKNLPQQSQFSVLEWATIFYYADSAKCLTGHKLLMTRTKHFIEQRNISTTYKYFKKCYYEAINRNDKVKDYPIDKLELILPFMNENFPRSVTLVENQIKFLRDKDYDY